MARVRCSVCGTEIEVTQANKSKACGCDNHTLLRLDRNGLPVLSAEDLSSVITIDGFSKPKPKKIDTSSALEYNKRIPRKLNYEVR